MAYLGVSPSNGVRQKHTYTATAGQTSFSGVGSENITLSYLDSNYVDVYQNGVKLSEADYTSTTGTTVVLAQGASVSDIVEIIVYDVFSVADTVSKADGGTFDGNITAAGTLAVTGALSAKGGAVFNEDSADVDFRVESNDSANMLFVNGGNNQVGIGVDAASTVFHVETSTDGTGVSGDEIYVAKFYNREATDSRSYGVDIHAGSNSTDQALRCKTHDGGTQLFLVKGDGSATIANGLTLTDGNLVVANGHGIDFSATSDGTTMSSELLDDYEEGEYTVTATPSDSGSITLNSSFNTGSYTKIGRFVNVGALVNVSAVSSPSGFIGINLPFTPANLGERAGDSVGSIYISGGASALMRDYVASVNEGDVRLFIQLGDGTSAANDSAQQIQANTNIVFNINYHTA